MLYGFERRSVNLPMTSLGRLGIVGQERRGRPRCGGTEQNGNRESARNSENKRSSRRAIVGAGMVASALRNEDELTETDPVVRYHANSEASTQVSRRIDPPG